MGAEENRDYEVLVAQTAKRGVWELSQWLPKGVPAGAAWPAWVTAAYSLDRDNLRLLRDRIDAALGETTDG